VALINLGDKWYRKGPHKEGRTCVPSITCRGALEGKGSAVIEDTSWSYKCKRVFIDSLVVLKKFMDVKATVKEYNNWV